MAPTSLFDRSDIADDTSEPTGLGYRPARTL
jgi:hypothetical protein